MLKCQNYPIRLQFIAEP